MKDLIGEKLMTFGVNGVFFFKALGWVLLGKFPLGGFHIHGVHCMAHKTNLVV
jgi:hypothetical protein